MNKKFKFLFIAFCSVALISSCNDSLNRDQYMPELEQKEFKYTGEKVNVQLSVQLKDDEKIGEKSVSATRSVIISKAQNSSIIKIDYEKLLNQKMNVYFALRKETMPDALVTYFRLEAKVVKTSDGNYALKADNQSITINKGELDSDYFIQGITLGPETNLIQNKQDGSFEYEMKVQRGGPISEIENNVNIRKIDIPLTTDWTKVNYDTKSKTIKIDNLTFKPKGVFLKFENIDSELNLNDKIQLRGIEIDAYGFCSSGTFKLGKLPSGKTINDAKGFYFDYKKTVATTDEIFLNGGLNQYGWSRLNIDISDANNKYTTLSNGGTNGCWVYVMPYKDENMKDPRLEYRYKYSPLNHHQNEVYKTEMRLKNFTVEKLNGGEVITIRNGGFHKSDLMISEFYHFNPTLNSSMIEIYNPTNADIDLRKYNLIKLRTITADKGPGIHPEDEWYEASAVLAQPVYIDPTVEDGVLDSKNPTGALYIKTQGGIGDSKLRFKYMYNTEENAKVGNGSYILKPGHCIVLCSQGIYKILTSKENPVKNTEYLPEGSEIGFVDLRNQILSKGGKCKYVMAVTNYLTKVESNDSQWNKWSGVFTHGSKHIMILTKESQDNRGLNTFELVDQAGPAFDYAEKFDFADKNGWAQQAELYNKYIEKFRFNDFVGNSTLGTRDDFGIIRRGGVMFPSPTHWNYDLDKLNDDPNRDWDIYMNSRTSTNDPSRPYELQFHDRVAKHNFGKRY